MKGQFFYVLETGDHFAPGYWSDEHGITFDFDMAKKFDTRFEAETFQISNNLGHYRVMEHGYF